MKKTVVILLILSILFVTACRPERDLNGEPTTQPTTIETTTRWYYNLQNPIEIERARMEQARQIHVPLLSEVLYFLEIEAVERYAFGLFSRNIYELTEVVVVSGLDNDGWALLRITIEGEVYYTKVNEQGAGTTHFTVEQWALRNQHIEFFAGKIDWPEGVAGLFALVPIQEILYFEEVEDFDRELEIQMAWPPESVITSLFRIEDVIGDVYYFGFCARGYLSTIRRNSTDGEIIYSPNKGLVGHL